MIKSNRLIWDNLAPRFAAELITSTSEVHFGVGIPGNSTFCLIHRNRLATAQNLHHVGIALCGTGVTEVLRACVPPGPRRQINP